MPKKDKYAGLSSDEFDRILRELLRHKTAADLLTIPGVYEAVSEEYNNDVLDKWEVENAS